MRVCLFGVSRKQLFKDPKNWKRENRLGTVETGGEEVSRRAQ
jgi:hypothetical protein